MAVKKMICHVEFLIGDNLSEEELQRLIEKGFDHAIFGMIQGLDISIDSDFCITEGFEESDTIGSSLTWIEKDQIAGKCLNEFLKHEPETSPLYDISSKLLRQLIIEGINTVLSYR